jgi:hypothetical protein
MRWGAGAAARTGLGEGVGVGAGAVDEGALPSTVPPGEGKGWTRR